MVGSARNFGAYDPRFLGMQVTLSSNEAVDTFNDFYVHKKILNVDRPEKHVVDKVWIGTVLEHEARHFHDALISPYSSKLLRLRMEIAANFDQVFNDIVAGGFLTQCNCAMVPAEKWIETPEDQRRSIIEKYEATGFFGSELRPLPLPIIRNQIQHPEVRRADDVVDYPVYPALPHDVFSHYGDEAVEARRLYMLRMAVLKDRYDQIDFLLRGLPFSEVGNLQPWEVFEASAVVIQMYAVHQSCIGFSATDFLRQLAGDAPRYIRALEPFLAPTTGPQLSRAVLIASTWSIMSGEVFGRDMRDWKVDEAQGSPAARYAGAVTWFRKNGLPKEDTSVFEIFANLDASFGCHDWKENLKLSLARNQLQAEKLADGVSTTADPRINGAIQAYLRFTIAQRELFSSGVFDLDHYTRPNKYLELANKLPHPPTLLDVGKLGLNTEQFVKSNERSGWFPVEEIDVNGQKVVSLAMAPHPTMNQQELIDVWNLFNYLREIDHLFSRHHRNETRPVFFKKLFLDRKFTWIEIT